MKIDNRKGKKMYIVWKGNREVQYFNSIADFSRYFEITWKTAYMWKTGKIKSELPFEIYDGDGEKYINN